MIEQYTPSEIIDARVQCLMALGYSLAEAAEIVAQTYKARPPAA